jgi:dihydroxyacid dehydratase/phosphogluconate dehydratase
MHLKRLGEAVKEGILMAGGVPMEFSTIAPCAGHCRDIGIDDEVLLYDLPQRDAIADSVEIQMRNYNAQGLVCIGTCDKIVPGHWLGAARLVMALSAGTNGILHLLSLAKTLRLDVDLDDALIAERLVAWEAPRPPITEGVLVDWHLTATQFPDGAMLQRRL